jgi:hypothetical protein
VHSAAGGARSPPNYPRRRQSSGKKISKIFSHTVFLVAVFAIFLLLGLAPRLADSNAIATECAALLFAYGG